MAPPRAILFACEWRTRVDRRRIHKGITGESRVRHRMPKEAQPKRHARSPQPAKAETEVRIQAVRVCRSGFCSEKTRTPTRTRTRTPEAVRVFGFHRGAYTSPRNPNPNNPDRALWKLANFPFGFWKRGEVRNYAEQRPERRGGALAARNRRELAPGGSSRVGGRRVSVRRAPRLRQPPPQAPHAQSPTPNVRHGE